MRRIPTGREDRSATIRDLDAERRSRTAGLDESASFAPRPMNQPLAPRHLELYDLAIRQPTSPSPLLRRDLAAQQLLEATEAAMRVARSADERGLWNARTFDMASLIQVVLSDAQSKARALGVALIQQDNAEGAPPQVVGDPYRLGLVLAKLVNVALEARDVSSLSVAYRHGRRDHQLTLDVILRLQRGSQPRPAASQTEADEIEIDSEMSLVLSPDLLAAAIGLNDEQGRRAIDPSAILRLRLPLARVEAGFANGRASSLFDETALNGLHILVVEDMDLNREMLRMLLSPYDCMLSEAANGRAALAAIDAESFDIILMDLQLPEMDGFEAMRRIRARGDQRAQVPILAVSGRAMAADIAKARAAGADGHLSKPYTTQDLITAIVKCRRAADQRSDG